MRDYRLPLMEHLLELRRRLVRVAAALAIGTGLAFAFHTQILRWLIAPVEGFGEETGGKLVFTEMTEMLGVTMKVSLVSGLILALPVVIFEVAMFVSPGLTARERRYLFALLPFSLLAFAGGASFGYFVLLPPALRFLTTFGADIAAPFIRIGNYINLVVTLLFWMGVAFELPLVAFVLGKVGVITAQGMGRFRRHAAVLAFALGAMITPTFDPINQSLVALPIIVLYELGILMVRLARLGQGRATAARVLPG